MSVRWEMIHLSSLRRIAVVVVNARSNDDFSYDKHEAPLSAFQLLMQSSSVPIDRFSAEAVYALEDVVRQWQLERKIQQDQRRLGAVASYSAGTARYRLFHHQRQL